MRSGVVVVVCTVLGAALAAASTVRAPAGSAPVGIVPAAATRSCAQPEGTLVAYGHSYLHSPRIGGAPSSYVTLAATALGVKPVIRAVDRGTTADVERLVRQGPTRWRPGTAQTVLIDSGTLTFTTGQVSTLFVIGNPTNGGGAPLEPFRL